jgi:hypothetical protein
VGSATNIFVTMARSNNTVVQCIGFLEFVVGSTLEKRQRISGHC